MELGGEEEIEMEIYIWKDISSRDVTAVSGVISKRWRIFQRVGEIIDED